MKEKFSSVGTAIALWVLGALVFINIALNFSDSSGALAVLVAILGKDAPAWVQAVGSILAILVAITIAMWQRHSDRKESESAKHARGKVAALGTLEMMEPLINYLHMVSRHADSEIAGPFLTLPATQKTLRSIVLPTESQLMVLAEAAPVAATYLVRGCTMKVQLLILIDAMKDELADGHEMNATKFAVIGKTATKGAIAFRDAAKSLCSYLDLPNKRFNRKLFRDDEVDRDAFPPIGSEKTT